MARFVVTDDGGNYVNLDHVVRTKRRKDAHGGIDTALLDAKGLELGVTSFDLDEFTAPVVPAVAASKALILTMLLDNERPEEGDVEARWIPIIAWRVFPDTAEPVFVNSLADNQHWHIELPDGGFLDGHGETYQSLTDAKVHVLKIWQADWDRRRRLPK